MKKCVYYNAGLEQEGKGCLPSESGLKVYRSLFVKQAGKTGKTCSFTAIDYKLVNVI